MTPTFGIKQKKRTPAQATRMRTRDTTDRAQVKKRKMSTIKRNIQKSWGISTISPTRFRCRTTRGIWRVL